MFISDTLALATAPTVTSPNETASVDTLRAAALAFAASTTYELHPESAIDAQASADPNHNARRRRCPAVDFRLGHRGSLQVAEVLEEPPQCRNLPLKKEYIKLANIEHPSKQVLQATQVNM